MNFPSKLQRGTLLKRYMRFLADIRLDDGTEITATCPNTGSMMGLKALGSPVWVSTSDSLTRKYKHTWEIVETDLGQGRVFVGINTQHPNKLVEAAIVAGLVPSLAGYATLSREQKYGVNSRIDILLDDAKKGRAYVEVKNVHLSRTAGLAEFPDSVTERGAKHLVELGDMVAAGHRAVMCYLVQRNDCHSLSFAAEIDPGYVAAYVEAVKRGVEVVAVRCTVSPACIVADTLIPVNAVAAATINALPANKPVKPQPRASRTAEAPAIVAKRRSRKKV